MSTMRNDFKIKTLIRMIVALFLFFMINITFVQAFFTNGVTTDNPYNKDQDYSIETGLDEVKNTIQGIEKDKHFSEYVQDVTVYLLGFVTIIAVIYMIYGGFSLMVSGGNEEKVKKTKNIIIYTILGIIVMWLAYAIVLWIFGIFDTVGT